MSKKSEAKGSGSWICTGVNRRFLARVRRHGHRKYELVGPPTKSYRVALLRLAKKFALGHYKRGDVIMTAEYYDPALICELTQ